MKGIVSINNQAGMATIDIEGVIGVAEELQFREGSGSISTYSSLKALLGRMEEDLPEAITVNIRSTGGSVNDALLIHDFLRSTGAVITTRCFGYVASAATVIAQAASPGRREISANALYLIHNSSCETEGNSGDLAATGLMLEQTDSRIAGIYSSASGRESSVYRELMGCNGGRGRWLSPREAVELGLADVITEKSRIGRSGRRLVRNLNLPTPPPGHEVGIGGLFRRVFSTAAPAEPAPAGGPSIPQAPEGMSGVPTAKKSLPDNSARAAAGPTQTLSREDPPLQEEILTPNQGAYLEDLRNIRNL